MIINSLMIEGQRVCLFAVTVQAKGTTIAIKQTWLILVIKMQNGLIFFWQIIYTSTMTKTFYTLHLRSKVKHLPQARFLIHQNNNFKGIIVSWARCTPNNFFL